MRFIQALFLFLQFICSINCSENFFDYKNFIIWGPGLNPNFTMPVRYFFIQIVDKNLKNFTYSPGSDFLKIKIYEKTESNQCRANLELLDRHDGSFVVRYRLYDNYKNIYISIRNRLNQHVAKSPYHLKGDLYQENCYCPETDLEFWYKTMNCNKTYTQIENDMRKFLNLSLDMDIISKSIIKRYNQRYSQSLCNYVILNNKIYKKCYGEYVDFSMFSDNILLSLTRKVKLPDTEFFINLGDWPLNLKNQKELLPIISWCGSFDSNDIVLPTYELTESTIEMMARQSLDVFSIQKHSVPDWKLKFNKSFWRGRDSRQERLDLVLMSKKRPDIIDAALTNMFFFREPEHMQKYGPIVERTSFFDFFKYKYQLNIDGTVAAYRFPYLMVGNSLVLKQDSNYYEHFYHDLEQFVHYVPVNKNLSNLIDRLEWAIRNDDRAQEIVRRANEYAREYLMPNHIYCYHVKFFMAYSDLIVSNIKVRKGMEELNQSMANCKCNKLKKKLKFDL